MYIGRKGAVVSPGQLQEEGGYLDAELEVFRSLWIAATRGVADALLDVDDADLAARVVDHTRGSESASQ